MSDNSSSELFHSNISQSEFDLNAGATGAAVVSITSHAGGAYQVGVSGLTDSWYNIPVSDVWLDRGGKGQLEVIFKPPLNVPPGDNVYNCAIVVTPLDGGTPARHPVQLLIRGAPGPSINVAPIRRSGSECVYKVSVLNTLPYDLTINMRAKDKFSENPKGGFKYAYNRQTFRLIKGSSEDIELTARPKRRPWFGLVSAIDFTAEAVPESQIYKPAVAEVKAYLYPGPPWWIFLLLILVLASLAWLLWPQPKDTEPPDGPPQGKIIVHVTDDVLYHNPNTQKVEVKGKAIPDDKNIGAALRIGDTVDFGTVALGQSKEKRFIIRNIWPIKDAQGKKMNPSYLRLNPAVTKPKQPFEALIIEGDRTHPALPRSLNPMQRHFITVRFKPDKAGKFTATLYLPNSARWEDPSIGVIDMRRFKVTLIGEAK